MKRKLISILVLINVITILSGCATLFKNKTAKLEINSDPQKATIYINGNRMGETPLPINWSHKTPVTITFKKDGYEDKTYIINTKVGAGWVILDCVGGFIPVVIDAVTGNWFSLEETNVKVILEKK